MIDAPRRIDFDEDDNYELGDTHFTIDQIADATGLHPSTVTHHLRHGRLKECKQVIRPGRGRPIAVEYDATLHAFFEHPAPERIDHERLVEMLQTQTPREVADVLGCTRRHINEICAQNDYDVPDWSYRWKREATYTRQLYAQTLSRAGYSRADIADALDCHIATVNHYLAGKYDCPEPVEGRTPLWERPPEEHGQWDPERDPRNHS